MISALLDLVLPVACAGCQTPGSRWCAACAVATEPRIRLIRPSPCPPGFPLTAAAAVYADVARAALLAHKEHGRRAARPALAGLLAAAVKLALEPAVGEPARPTVLVPVPSSAAAVRARGGDPVLAMTQAAAALLGPQVSVLPLLRQIRTPSDQAGLTAAERAANLAGALEVRQQPGQALLRMRLVIVDDVCTTGATLAEAARALRQTGVLEPRAAVVAATARRGGGALASPCEGRP